MILNVFKAVNYFSFPIWSIFDKNKKNLPPKTSRDLQKTHKVCVSALETRTPT